jgi:glucose/arabinose dehydrogenase
VVGIDNYNFGWLQIAPEFHDTPGMNIILTGNASSTTRNPLTPEPNDTATTGAFVAFGNSTVQGQTIKGEIKCNGCIISANPDGSDLQIEAWGLRNPFGLAFSQNGTLLVTMNGADERGSRPIANDTDKIYTIDVTQSPKFYGWPDYFGNGEPVTEEKFQSVRDNQSLQFIMQEHPEVVKPLSEVQVAAALTQADFSNSSNFGHEGMAFAAEFGSMIPATHAPQEVAEPVQEIGHKIIMVDPQTGNYSNFLSLKQHSHLFRPVGVEFNEQEGALYVVSIGKMEVRTTLPNGTPLPNPMPWPYDNTGIVWKIVKSGGNDTVTTSASQQQQQQRPSNLTQQQQQ